MSVFQTHRWRQWSLNNKINNGSVALWSVEQNKYSRVLTDINNWINKSMGGEGKVQLLPIKDWQLINVCKRSEENRKSSLGHPRNKLLQARTSDEC